MTILAQEVGRDHLQEFVGFDSGCDLTECGSRCIHTSGMNTCVSFSWSTSWRRTALGRLRRRSKDIHVELLVKHGQVLLRCREQFSGHQLSRRSRTAASPCHREAGRSQPRGKAVAGDNADQLPKRELRQVLYAEIRRWGLQVELALMAMVSHPDRSYLNR